jgi:hypothetical protein
MNMRITLIVFALFGLTVHSDGVAQTNTPGQVRLTGLLVNQRVAEYFGEVYTRTSLEDFVFFQGEPITYRVAVQNVGTTESVLVLASTNPQQLFTVEGLKAPPIPDERITIKRPVSNGRFLDEVDFDLPLRVSPPVKTWPGGSLPIALEREIRLDSKEGVEWAVDLPTDLEPGLYRIVVKVNGSERGGRSLRSFARFRFEVRAPTADAQPEILRRQASRLWSKEDFIAARQAIAELLKVHPNSAEGYGILGLIADREGNSAEAAAHRTRANQITQEKLDALQVKYRGQTLH